MLDNTYHARLAAAVARRLNVYVLDDSARARGARRWPQATASATLPARPGPLKKAGQPAVRLRAVRGRLHPHPRRRLRPAPRLLHELVPYFDDPTVGIVQSPQFFDARLADELAAARGRRDAGALLPLGAAVPGPQHAADLRRHQRALPAGGTRPVGGFAPIGHSEDVHTGVNLLSVGYAVRYVPIARHQGPLPRHPRPVRHPAVPLVHRLDEPAVLAAASTA